MRLEFSLVSLKKVEFGKYGFSAEVGGTVIQMRHGKSVQYDHRVEATVISANSLGVVFFLIIWMRLAQGLLDGTHIPSSINLLNSAFAIFNLSGLNLRGRLATGGPIVTMWYSTSLILF